jgi:Tetratricopeptide repeat
LSCEFPLAEAANTIADYRNVEQDTSSTLMRRAIPAVALFVSAVMIYHAVRFWLADYRVNTEKLASIESGLRLEPGDADGWDALGRFRQLDFTSADPAQSLAAYERAVAENPHSATLHMNLAAAYEAAGEIPKARAQFAAASAAYPLSAEVDWNYGNFLLRQDEDDAGYAEIRKAVQIDRTLLPLAASRVWRSSHDVEALLDNVLPRDADAYYNALDYFSAIHQTAPSIAVWQRLISLRQPIELSKSFPLIDALIAADDSTNASRVWREALGASGITWIDSPNRSLLWNGDFAREFVNGGLGWRYDTKVGATLDFDTVPGGHQGRSIRMDFGGGTNLEIDQPMEYVPVEPNKAYVFRADMRTEDITTESGLRFWIFDPNHPNAVNVLTENLTGSNPWKTVTESFITGPETHFVVVRLRRAASRLFENRLSGTVWVSSTFLTPAESPAEPSAK